MADADKAEKLAAAKKKFEQLKKQKAKKEAAAAGGASASAKKADTKKEEKVEGGSKAKSKANAEPAKPIDEKVDEDKNEEKSEDVTAAAVENGAESVEDKHTELPSSTSPPAGDDEANTGTATSGSSSKKRPGRQPSISEQSRLRSSSFLKGQLSPTSPGLVSPFGGDSAATEIYKKQAAQITDLEKELKTLRGDLADKEGVIAKLKAGEDGRDSLVEDLGREKAEAKKWREKAESVEKDKKEQDEKFESLKKDVAALERQRDQLLNQSKKGGASGGSGSASDNSELKSKDAAIEAMEMEISRLKSTKESLETTNAEQKSRISSLESSLRAAEESSEKAQAEMTDMKRNLERASERAVKEGSERSSAETKIRSLTRDLDNASQKHKDLERELENAESKIKTLTTLHKESETRASDSSRAKSKAERELSDLRSGKLESLEGDNLKLRKELEKLRLETGAAGADLDGMEELEDEERERLRKKVEGLERELASRRGEGAMIVEGQYDDVDLSVTTPKIGGGGNFRRTSSSAAGGRTLSSGAGGVIGAGGLPSSSSHSGNGFAGNGYFYDDSEEKRRKEEEQARLERVKELKRRLKEWEGWRIDLVDRPSNWSGIWGEKFEV